MLSLNDGYMWFQIESGLTEEVSISAAACGIQHDELFPDVRSAIRVLEIFRQMVWFLKKMNVFQSKISVYIAGAGFINFKL